eukprot:CAMPEP_0115163856 /NCGR_PEP_ID=MMETSP0227-20121206/72728_1 /TAXON_ID=89957 /ORGANISM="Polarella glacialis, Strain CCMP 1383" /LENGTH=335 /DNA_ID=CAMNT_0002576181 /DNA_START=22 /DNA_END=1026 /DNA_ORIENTATION=-
MTKATALRPGGRCLERRLSDIPACNPDEVGLDSSALEDHRSRMTWQISKNVVPGMAECVLARNGVAYLDCQGKADREFGTKVSQHTLFRCFSMTKPITAVAVMRLVEAGKLGLDDPVSKHIPSFKNTRVVCAEATDLWGCFVTPKNLEPQSRPMTVRHLLTHTSGLGYGSDRYEAKEKLPIRSPCEESYAPLLEAVDEGKISTLAQFCDALAELPLRFQPGTQYLYSHGVDVAGRIVEVVSGMSLAAYLRQNVLVPCGMTRTTFGISSNRLGDLAAMYNAVIKEQKTQKETASEETAGEQAAEFSVKLNRVDGLRPEESAWFGQPRILAGGGMMG